MLAGVHGVARARGVGTVAIHTVGMELCWPDEPGTEPLALDAIDGWIAVSEFDSFHFTSRVAARGTPLVYLSERPEGLECCSVLADNRGGALAATRHLLEHGHERIGFVGFLGQLDLRERHEGYIQAHREVGREPDPSLLYWTANNLEIDGRKVGRKLIASGKLPCTAVVGGTDKTALGIMESLSSAGYSIPRELAIVGFDDIEKAQYAQPPLSTVRQRFDLLAARAAEILIEHLLDGVPLPSVVRVPTVFVTRESCGCATNASLSMPAVSQTREQPHEALLRALLEAAGNRDATTMSELAWPGARRIATHLHSVATGAEAYEAARLTGVWEGYLSVSRDVESIESVIALLEAFTGSWCYPADEQADRPSFNAYPDVQIALRQLRLELMRTWRVAELIRSRYYDFVAEANGKINVALAGTDFATAKSLSWLKWTRIPYGALGLWRRAGEGCARSLEVISEYGAGGATTSLKGSSFSPGQFPPPMVQDLVRHVGDENMLMIVPVTSPNGNRGLLAVAGPVEVELLDHVGSVHDWAALVGASLEREDVEEQLRDHALRDSLTGMPNRSLLMERLEQVIARARCEPTERFAVLFMDLDDFKHINDSLGHLAGDELLIEIAQRLQASLRDTDTIARLGGDEFAVLVPNVIHDSDVFDVVSRIQEALRAPFSLKGNPVFTSCSTGVVLNSARHESAADLLRDADIALYRAKLQGRGRHEVFDDGMHAQAVERLQLDSRLRNALTNGEFELFFQPLLSLQSGMPVGAEALIRWNHPEQGFLEPGRFLGVAEDVGLAIPISRWVIETACAEVARWRSGGRNFYVNVNIPAQHFKDPQFVDVVQAALAQFDLPPEALGLELVEGSLIENHEDTIRRLELLRDLGFRTAIDDFGTGYSSLSYLKSFPLSVLKMDRSFIQGVPEALHDTAIVRAIIAMAHGLDLTVVAEGVERPEQADFLRDEGCDFVQGFLLSRPLPAVECRRFLAEHSGAAAVLAAG
jgi:diguanylate cyclase (GGDEF)-like protein